MNILFIADPLKHFKIYKDTTYAMMRTMHQRGWHLFHALSEDLVAYNQKVSAQVIPFDFIEGDNTQKYEWFMPHDAEYRALSDFDAVIMRTDPPFDMQYLYATHLLSLAEEQGAKVFNSGKALREYNEKLAILRFPKWISPTIVTTHMSDIRLFLEEHQDIIIKPLDGMGGMGIFRLRPHDANIGSVLEMMTNQGTRTIMAQRYIPEITQGDKRVLVIGGEVMPFTLARIPQNGETRGNLAAGGQGVAQPITEIEKQIAQSLAPQLMKDGIVLAGLDIIGNHLTEINVTSPTCFQEITQQTGFDVSSCFVDAIERSCSVCDI